MARRGSATFLGTTCVVGGLALAACVPARPMAHVLTPPTRARTTSASPAPLPAAAAAPSGVSTISLVDPTPVVEHPEGELATTRSSVATGRARAESTSPTSGFAGKADPGTGPDVWAVLVGVQNYHGSTHHTYGGRGDVEVFDRLLSRAGWPADHVLELVDDDATADNIRAAMSWLVARTSPSSFVLFHYSGHVCQADVGPCGSGHRYLWGVDNRFIANDEFSRTMQGLQGQAWVDVAGCEAADFDHGVSSPNRLFTASSQANEKSYESKDWNESVWTGLLVDQGMLQGRADTDGDGRVSIDEAARWASPRATAMTDGEPQGPQHPYAAGGQAGWYVATPSQHPGQGAGGGSSGPPPSPKPCGKLDALLHRC